MFTGVGLLFVIYRLVPHSFLKALKPDFTEDMSGFFLVGTFPTIFQADARLASDSSGEIVDTTVTGVGEDFFATNRFGIALAAPEYTGDDGPDAAAVWSAVQANPGLAVVNATIVPRRTNSAFALPSDQFTLNDVEGLFVENDNMDPVIITVRDLESGNTLELTAIGGAGHSRFRRAGTRGVLRVDRDYRPRRQSDTVILQRRRRR